MRTIRLVETLSLVVLLLTSGCSHLHKGDYQLGALAGSSNHYSVPASAVTTKATGLLATEINAPDIKKWHRIAFHHHWDKSSQPTWSNDLIIAQRIVAPVLKQYRHEIALWRFHRRAVVDETGHRFTFIVYASDAVVAEISNLIHNNSVLIALLNNKILSSVSYSNLQLIGDNFAVPHTKSDIDTIASDAPLDETSDKSWPMEIQLSWPYYIMGVSEMWLSLIEEIDRNRSIAATTLSFAELLTHYKELDEVIGAYWGMSGQHAYLHHLNAIFEYQPLQIKEVREMRF